MKFKSTSSLGSRVFLCGKRAWERGWSQSFPSDVLQLIFYRTLWSDAGPLPPPSPIPLVLPSSCPPLHPSTPSPPPHSPSLPLPSSPKHKFLTTSIVTSRWSRSVAGGFVFHKSPVKVVLLTVPPRTHTFVERAIPWWSMEHQKK